MSPVAEEHPKGHGLGSTEGGWHHDGGMHLGGREKKSGDESRGEEEGNV